MAQVSICHYIIRNDLNDGFPPGAVVTTECIKSKIKDELVWVARIDRAAHGSWVCVGDLLPLERYLKRKPKRHFYYIVQRSRWLTEFPSMLESVEPYKLTHTKPIRFESLGEAVFCMKQNKLSRRDVRIMKTVDV